MSFNSKYTGQQVENLLDQVANGNAGGGGEGGVSVELDPVFSASPAAKITDDNISAWNNKVDTLDLLDIISPIEQQIAAKQENLVSGTNIKTINGMSVLGEGNIAIIGGGSSAYPRVDYAWTAGSETISPNTFHVWGSVTGLSIEFGEEVSGVANEYLFQFTCDIYDESIITLPDTIVWANGEPTFDSGSTYQISVLNGIGLVVKNEIIIG